MAFTYSSAPRHTGAQKLILFCNQLPKMRKEQEAGDALVKAKNIWE